jgi:hypothetical protein
MTYTRLGGPAKVEKARSLRALAAALYNGVKVLPAATHTHRITVAPSHFQLPRSERSKVGGCDRDLPGMDVPLGPEKF